jgi:serpin B
MRAAAFACAVGWALFACNATNTGNPGQGRDAPAGIELVRSSLERATDPRLSEDEASRFGSDSRDFAFSLYHQLRGPDENLFYSPYSIAVALGMTYGGARGDTKAEMASALHFTLEDNALHRAFNVTDLALKRRSSELTKTSDTPASGTGFQLDVINSAFLAKDLTFVDDYLDLLAVNYGAGLYRADFGGAPEEQRLAINDWVAAQTRTRIKDLLPERSITDAVVFVLVNAIYFKASWLQPFDPKLTETATFRSPAGEREVEMMNDHTAMQYARGDNYAAVSLPYISESVRMLFILPDEGKLGEFEAGFDRARFDAATDALSEYEVRIKVPKFSFEFEVKLKQTMQALGMERAFEGIGADFSGIAGTPGEIWIDAIYHKAFVALDEQGTEAAASTAVVGVAESAKPQADFYLDRPFLFAIYDRPTGQILFIGRLLDPR